MTGIGNSAFANCNSLTGIAIPDSIKNIGNYAFSYCFNLKSIIIPASVTSIGVSAFSYCEELTNVAIPDSVKTIGGSTFANCGNLKSIVIPDSVTIMGSSTFSGCSSLTIYTECSSTPSDWGAFWNNSIRPVIWDCRLSDDKSYVVSFTKSVTGMINSTASNGISAPYREGYTFGGWSTTPGSTIVAYTAENVNTAPDNTILYAIWI